MRSVIESLETRRLLANITWYGNSGNSTGDGISWDDPNNWSTLTVPGPNDNVHLAYAFPVIIDHDVTIAGMFMDSADLIVDGATFTCPSLAIEMSGDIILKNGSTLRAGGDPFTIEGVVNVGVAGDTSENRIEVIGQTNNFNGAGDLIFTPTSVLDLTQSSSLNFDMHHDLRIAGATIVADAGTTFYGQGILKDITTTSSIHISSQTSLAGTIRLGGDLSLDGEFKIVDDTVIEGDYLVTIPSQHTSAWFNEFVQLTISPEVMMRWTGSGQLFADNGNASLINLGSIEIDGSELEAGESWDIDVNFINSGTLSLINGAKVDASGVVGYVNQLTTRDAGTVLLLDGQYVLGDTDVGFGSTMYLSEQSWSFSSMDVSGTVIFDHASEDITTLNHIRQKVSSGYANNAWNGIGLRNPLAAIDERYTLGYGPSSAILGPNGGTFEEVEVDSTAVIVHHTLDSDFNLDGTVNFHDLLRLSQSYGSSNHYFSDGDTDFNYYVSFADLLRTSQLYGQSLFSSLPIVLSKQPRETDLRSILK